jgi:hypothetical protein
MIKSYTEWKTDLLESEGYFEPSTQYGSNQGGIFHEGGSRSYLKFPKQPEQAHVEAAMAEMYNHLGIQTHNPEIVNHFGKVGVKSPWNPNLTQLEDDDLHKVYDSPKHSRQLAMIHHAAVLSKNYDVVGLVRDNLLHDTKTDNLVSLDQGGSMHFRAQGAPKEFTPDVSEIESFKNPHKGAGSVFAGLFKNNPYLGRETANTVQDKLSDEYIDGLMAKHGLQNHADTLKKRRDLLIAHYHSS